MPYCIRKNNDNISLFINQQINLNWMVIKRKIVGYSYSKLICLPKYWLEQHNFKKGDEVRMEIDSKGNLVLRGKSGTTE